MKNKPYLVARETLERHLLVQYKNGKTTREQAELVSGMILLGDVTSLEDIDNLLEHKEATMKTDPAVAAIEFALSRECEDPMSFLRCWNEGEFDSIRREWPEAPQAVFMGADPSVTPGFLQDPSP